MLKQYNYLANSCVKCSLITEPGLPVSVHSKGKSQRFGTIFLHNKTEIAL